MALLSRSYNIGIEGDIRMDSKVESWYNETVPPDERTARLDNEEPSQSLNTAFFVREQTLVNSNGTSRIYCVQCERMLSTKGKWHVHSCNYDVTTSLRFRDFQLEVASAEQALCFLKEHAPYGRPFKALWKALTEHVIKLFYMDPPFISHVCMSGLLYGGLLQIDHKGELCVTGIYNKLAEAQPKLAIERFEDQHGDAPVHHMDLTVKGDAVSVREVESWYSAVSRAMLFNENCIKLVAATTVRLFEQRSLGDSIPHEYYCIMCRKGHRWWPAHVCAVDVRVQLTFKTMQGGRVALSKVALFWAKQHIAKGEAFRALWKVLSKHVIELFRLGVFISAKSMQSIMDHQLLDEELLDTDTVRMINDILHVARTSRPLLEFED